MREIALSSSLIDKERFLPRGVGRHSLLYRQVQPQKGRGDSGFLGGVFKMFDPREDDVMHVLSCLILEGVCIIL